LKSRGAITAPCGTPAFISKEEEKEEPTYRKEPIFEVGFEDQIVVARN